VDIDLAWTPDGRNAAFRAGLTLAEVIEVVYSPKSIAIMVQASGALWFVGEPNTEPVVVTVICDRQARNTTIYEITDVRLATPGEQRAWRSKQ
jgi:hypothetical protein